MSVRVIILLGIFVWAPLMGFLIWKYAQTFAVVQRSRSKRRAKRALMLTGAGVMMHNDERRSVRRSF